MNTTPDGQFQTYAVESGAYTRENFFGGDPRLRAMVEHLSDDEIRNLSRGGHDYRKVYAAFKAATEHVGQPTVILAHTIKGWTLGPDFEARNATHQMKKLTVAELKEFRDRLYLEIPDCGLGGRAPAVLPPRREVGRDPVHARAPGRARRLPAEACGTGQAPGTAGRFGLRGAAPRLGQAAGCHHDGVRPAAQGPDEGPGDRRPVRAGDPGRGPHVRDGLAVPDGEDLRPARARPTRLSTATCCCPTRSPAAGRSCTRASARPARWRRPPQPGPRTPPTART